MWTCHVGPQMGVLLLNGLVCSPVQTEKQSGLGPVLGGVGGGPGLPSPLDLGAGRPSGAAASRCLIGDEMRRGDTVSLSLLFRLGH